MIITVFDTETTGLKADGGDRIIEVALLTYDSATRHQVGRFVQRIDPERAIGAEAQAIHGIGYHDLVGMPKFRDVAAIVHERYGSSGLIVAHNLAFDIGFLRAEFMPLGLALPPTPGVCTMSGCRWATPDGKLPKLGELAFALGVPYDTSSAHAADYDCEVTIACFWRALERGFIALPTGVVM